MNKSNHEIELIKLKAIQTYLLERGSNDELINEKIKSITKELLEIEKNRNK